MLVVRGGKYVLSSTGRNVQLTHNFRSSKGYIDAMPMRIASYFTVGEMQGRCDGGLQPTLLSCWRAGRDADLREGVEHVAGSKTSGKNDDGRDHTEGVFHRDIVPVIVPSSFRRGEDKAWRGGMSRRHSPRSQRRLRMTLRLCALLGGGMVVTVWLMCAWVAGGGGGQGAA